MVALLPLPLLPLLLLLLRLHSGYRVDLHDHGGDILQMRPGKSIWGKMRNALPNNSLNRWTVYRDESRNYVMPFIITGKFEPEERAIIFSAMRALERNTCLRFKRRERERDYIDIRNEKNEGCYTSVGRHRGRNIVMLEANELATCAEHDIVIHELMHSVGLWHEHMRYDRDDYITVNFDKIASSFYSQFEKISKQESTTYGVEYDYRSVMHYAEDAFSEQPGEITMNVIGNAKTASPSDYIKICSIYKCGVCMGKPFGKRKATKKSDSDEEPERDDRVVQVADCEDSAFCDRLSRISTKDQLCTSAIYRRWCCASCL